MQISSYSNHYTRLRLSVYTVNSSYEMNTVLIHRRQFIVGQIIVDILSLVNEKYTKVYRFNKISILKDYIICKNNVNIRYHVSINYYTDAVYSCHWPLTT